MLLNFPSLRIAVIYVYIIAGPSILSSASATDNNTSIDGPPQACSTQPRNVTPDATFKFGSLHDVVGQDGVLVISLQRKRDRFLFSVDKLKQAHIWPTEFAAADLECLSESEVSQGCYKAESPGTCEGRAGAGCTSGNEQAVSESHRRALEAAMTRKNDWTAILEDDVMPVRPKRWNAAFKKAWKTKPDHVKLVRLSWCHFPSDPSVQHLSLAHQTFQDTGDFQFLNWTGYQDAGGGQSYNPGLCTSAYMVHRDIIPEMLKLFPCCCAVDCCLLYDLFGKGWEQGKPRGLEFMMHLDAWGSTDYSKGLHLPWVHQGGVMVQNARDTPSTQWWADTIESVDNPTLK